MPEGADPADLARYFSALIYGMAVLAAAGERQVADAAGEMVTVREVIEPRESRAEGFLERYLRLVGELERRGWLAAALADHARARSGSIRAAKPTVRRSAAAP